MDISLRLAIALGIGLLIGLEREYSSHEASKLFAGVRTLPLIAILGFLAAFLSETYTIWIFVTAFIALVTLVGISYFILARDGSLGGTTEITVLVTFLVGALVFREEISLAVEVAIAITLLLTLKLQFKTVLGKINQEDIFALLKFLIMTAIILPILPDRRLGPYDAINPREVWYMVILITGVSFSGYLISKFAGAGQGIMLTSILGGIASSTVLTYDFSEKSKQSPSAALNYGVGIVLASSIMFVRLAVLIYALSPALALRLLLPFTLLTAIGMAFSIMLIRRNNLEQTASNVDIGNPLNIKGALKFAVVFSGVLILVHIAQNYFGENGVYVVSVISGTVEMDAITVSMTKFAQNDASIFIAANAIISAALANTAFKYGITLMTAAPVVKKVTSRALGSMLLAGIMYLLIINLFRSTV